MDSDSELGRESGVGSYQIQSWRKTAGVRVRGMEMDLDMTCLVGDTVSLVDLEGKHILLKYNFF